MSSIEFKLPQLSMTMIDGVVSQWLKDIGDYVEQDQPLVDIETDKVTMTVNAPVSGYLQKIAVQNMGLAKVGETLCVISSEQTSETDLIEENKTTEEKPFSDRLQAKQQILQHKTAHRDSNVKVKISPLAKNIATEKGVDYTNLQGTGPDGLIVKRDILQALASPVYLSEFPTLEPEELERIPLQGIRKVTAEHMMKSKQSTAAVTTFAEVDLSRVKACRKFLKLSYTSYVAMAATKALQEFPIINSQIDEEEIVLYKSVNLNIAVGTGKSLVTPVIRETQDLNIISLAQKINELSEIARDGKLELSDFEGGTFTVTNSGVFGSLFFTPIINHPQAAILGMGKIKDTLVMVDGEVKTIPEMILCLSYDHQIVDGETSVKFLQKVKYYLENISELLI